MRVPMRAVRIASVSPVRRALSSKLLVTPMRRFVFIRSPVVAVDTGRSQNVGYEQRQVMAALARLSGCAE